MKQLVKNYTFNAIGKTITFSDFTSINLDRVQLVTDVTSNVIIYQFNNSSLGGTASGNILSLTYNTASLNSGDHLQIVYDAATGDPLYDLPTVEGNVASGTADSGNPVKVGGVYNTSLPSLLTGQRADLQLDNTGRLITNNRALQQSTDAVTASLSPTTSGGWAPSSQVALTNTVASIKSSAGQVGGWMFYNPNTSAVYIQVYNAVSGSVTVGTTTAAYVLALPPGAAANVEYANGITHSTAISAAATTTATGSTAPTNPITGFFLRV